MKKNILPAVAISMAFIGFVLLASGRSKTAGIVMLSVGFVFLAITLVQRKA